MKKGIMILLSLLIATAFLPACSAMGNTDSYETRDFAMATPMPLPAPEASAPGMVMYDDMMIMADGEASRVSMGGSNINSMYNTSGTDLSGTTQTDIPDDIGLSEKIIYSIWAEIETRNFDETLAKVDTLINNHGAFIENSNERGVTYSHSGQSYRHAYFQIRVPASQLTSVRNSLNGLGNVVSRSDNATNVTAQFIDTEARRNSLLVQEERILDMLSKVEELTDLILLEQHLSGIRYQIESLTSTLNNWQRQVDYSTLTLNINEVEEFTEFVPIHRTYWEQMGDGIMATLRGIGNFFTSIFMWLVVSGPVLLILIGIGLIIFIIVRSNIRKYNKNKPQRPAAQYYPPVYPSAPPVAPAPTVPVSPPETQETLPEQAQQDNQE